MNSALASKPHDCLEGHTLKEAVQILIGRYGYDAVSDEVLEHTP
jgi:hypothetical protein